MNDFDDALDRGAGVRPETEQDALADWERAQDQSLPAELVEAAVRSKPPRPRRRIGWLLAAALPVVLVLAFLATAPLEPGWDRRRGMERLSVEHAIEVMFDAGSDYENRNAALGTAFAKTRNLIRDLRRLSDGDGRLAQGIRDALAEVRAAIDLPEVGVDHGLRDGDFDRLCQRFAAAQDDDERLEVLGRLRRGMVAVVGAVRRAIRDGSDLTRSAEVVLGHLRTRLDDAGGGGDAPRDGQVRPREDRDDAPKEKDDEGREREQQERPFVD